MIFIIYFGKFHAFASFNGVSARPNYLIKLKNYGALLDSQIMQNLLKTIASDFSGKELLSLYNIFGLQLKASGLVKIVSNVLKTYCLLQIFQSFLFVWII